MQFLRAGSLARRPTAGRSLTGRSPAPHSSVRRAALAVTAGAAVLLAACGSSSSSSGAAPARPISSGTSGSGTSVSAGAASSGAGSAGAAGGIDLTQLPGHLVTLSNSNNYSSGGTETLARLAPDGEGRQVLLTSHSATLGLLTISPDGTRIAYYSGTSSSAHIDVMTLATRRARPVLTLKGSNAYLAGLAWAPDGTQLILATNMDPGHAPAKTSALYEMPATGGKLTRLTPFDDAGNPTTAPNGDLVYVTSKTFSTTSGFDASTLWLANPDGTAPRRVLRSRWFIAGPQVAPNGLSVLFALTHSTTTSNLATVGLNGANLTSVTPPVKGRSDILPAWSPQGTDIAFLSSRRGRHEGTTSNQLMDAYVVTPRGTAVTPLITLSGSKQSLDLIAWGS